MCFPSAIKPFYAERRSSLAARQKQPTGLIVADDSKATEVGARYAQALFDLAKDENQIAGVESDLKALKAMIAESADLRTLLYSPAFDADAKGKGLLAIADRAAFGALTKKFLGFLSDQRRAGALGAVITSFIALSAAYRGVVSAQVTTAVPLTAAQSKGLLAALRASLGKDPEIETRVDPAILGGLKVRVGSRLFDASLKSKLDSLKFALKRA
jgi:F-type H+-transporting ATPase subunit delta